MSTMKMLGWSLGISLWAGAAAAQTCPAPAPPKANAEAARLGAEKITVAAVDKTIADTLCQAQMEHAAKVAELREQAVERMVDERVLALEVKARKLPSIEALVEAAVKPVEAVTEKEAKAFYEANKGAMEGREFAQVQAQIMGYLTQERQQQAVGALLAELRKKHGARITLAPFRVAVPAGGITRGPKNAPIHIVEFADYECGFCARALPTLEALKAKYGDQIRWTFRDFPLGFHERAVPASIAARCAGQQGKYWEMHDKLFANMRALGDADLTGYAKALGLDAKRFATCQADPSVAAAVEADAAVGRRLGISGTPAFFINGQRLTGAQPLEAFVEIIDRELSKP